MVLKQSHYTPLGQYDVDEGRLFHSGSPTDVDNSSFPLASQLERKPKKAANTVHRWERVTRGVLLLLSAVFFTLWIASASMRECTYDVKYSPADEAIEYIERVKYQGALYTTSQWRGNGSGNPSSDIDAAWRRITTDVKPIRVTEQQLVKMGIAVSPTTVTIPVEGGGYLASLEVTHHLQCLDMLRKATFREHYASFDPSFQIEDETLMNQLDTCVELLRQALMCYPDINMVAYYWVHDRKFPVGDSNTIHRCKNFGKVLDWAAWKAVDMPHTPSDLMEKSAISGM